MPAYWQCIPFSLCDMLSEDVVSSYFPIFFSWPTWTCNMLQVVPNLLVDQVRKLDNRKNRGIGWANKPIHFVQLESAHQFFWAAVLQEQNQKGRRGMGKNLPKQPEIHLAAKDLKKW